MTPFTVKGFLAKDPEFGVTTKGTKWVKLSIGVSFYQGKDSQGKSEYLSKFFQVTGYDGEYDKIATAVAEAGWKKGTPVLAVLRLKPYQPEQGKNLFYQKDGSFHEVKEPRDSYILEEVGLWARVKRDQQTDGGGQPAQQGWGGQQPQQGWDSGQAAQQNQGWGQPPAAQQGWGGQPPQQQNQGGWGQQPPAQQQGQAPQGWGQPAAVGDGAQF